MKIRRTAFAAMVAHARAERPNECCGLLLGSGDLIDQAVRARNARESPTRFLIHPEDHFGALRLARASGRTVVGAYHSHPAGPPHPSETDRAEMHDGGLLYVIVSLAGAQPEVRAFAWTDADFRPVSYDVA